MQKFFSSHAAVSALALMTVCGAAHADLKVVQTTSIDSPQLKAYEETMTPQQKASMAKSGNPLFQNGPQQTTVYEHGRQIRTDIGSTSYLINSATRQTITLNRRIRNYTTQPYRTPPTTGQGTVNVKDTGQTKTFAGHLARHYLLTATLAAQPGTLIQGDIWAASDIPQPTMLSTGSGPFAVLQSLFHKIKGYPLKSTLTVTGSPLGNTTVTTNVVSVSKSPLPDSLFSIPAGYTKSAAEARG
ncbi:MAG: DUF4412 domain-containing protein [Janthinobacterium lividum]